MKRARGVTASERGGLRDYFQWHQRGVTSASGLTPFRVVSGSAHDLLPDGLPGWALFRIDGGEVLSAAHPGVGHVKPMPSVPTTARTAFGGTTPTRSDKAWLSARREVEQDLGADSLAFITWRNAKNFRGHLLCQCPTPFGVGPGDLNTMLWGTRGSFWLASAWLPDRG